MAKIKLEISNGALPHERCQYRTPTGRQCASKSHDPESSFCVKHAASQLNDYEDLAHPLTHNASRFLNAQGINYSLAALYKLLASGRISPRRASALAYISSLLLRSLNAIDNDARPNAGKDPAPNVPISQGEVEGILTINGKSVSFAMPAQNPKNPQGGIAINGKKVNLAAAPTHTRAGKIPYTNPVPQRGIEPPLPPGKTPMPATRKEFAQQVFAHLKQSESELPHYVLKNPLYQAHTSNLPTTPPPAPTAPPPSAPTAPPTPPESPPA